MPGGEGGRPVRWGREPQDLLATSKDGTHTLLRRCRLEESFGAVRPHLGELTLIARLGRGGMGAVFLAWHPIRERQVAVKVLPDVQHLERFRREARIATELRSPHFVTVYDVERDSLSGLYYLVMEFVSGKSAADWAAEVRAKGGPVPERDALQVATAAARGIAAAHAAGIVHRDLKPDNLLIPASAAGVPDLGAAKVIDLGLARSMSTEQRLTNFGDAMGTPGYMPAEQCLNAYHASPMSDVFALGATLYDLLAGSPPFPKNLRDALLKTPAGDYVPLTQRRPDVSGATAAIVAKCLAKEPRERFAHAGELLASLEAAQRDLDSAVRGPAPVPRAVAAPPAARETGAAARPAGGGAASGGRSLRALAVAVVVTAAAVGVWWIATRRDAANPAMLRVTSEPAGAEVFVDGVRVGVTPLAATEIPAERRVRVVVKDAAGEELLRKAIRAKPGESLDLDARKR